MFSDSRDLTKDAFKKPDWMETGDGLNQIYIDLENLYQSGRVVYAHIVQANELLFEPFSREDCPASIVFSADPHFEESPHDLWDIADELYGYKDTDAAPTELEEIVGAITDEYARPLNVPLPLSKTNNRLIYFSSIMVYRNHIPKEGLTSLVIPIICLPEELKASVILPKQYWTAEFMEAYVIE